MSTFGQLQSYSFEVKAEQNGADLEPVLFTKIESNTFFAAATEGSVHSPNKFYLSLLDSCGSALKSIILSIERLSGVYEYDYAVMKHGKRYVFMARIDHRIQLFFLEENLEPYASVAFEDYGELRFSPFGQNDFVAQSRNGSQLLGFWHIKPMVADAIFYSIQSGNEKTNVYPHTIKATENGLLYVAGELGTSAGLDDNSLFLAKYDEKLRHVLTVGYKSETVLPEPFGSGVNLIVNQDESLALVAAGKENNEWFYSIQFDSKGKPLELGTYRANTAGGVSRYGLLGQMYPNAVGHSCHTGTTVREGFLSKELICSYEQNENLRFYKLPDDINPSFSQRNLEVVSSLTNDVGIGVNGVRWGTEQTACNFLSEYTTVTKTIVGLKILEAFPILSLKKEKGSVDFLRVSLLPSVSEIRWKVDNECPSFTHKILGVKDTAVCVGTLAKLTSRLKGGAVEWNTGAKTISIVSDTSGLFYNTIESGFCKAIDSQKLTVVDSININLPDSAIACPNITFDFGLEKKAYSYEWTFPDKSKQLSLTLKAREKGLYRLRVYGGGCKVIDSVAIDFHEVPNASAGPDGKLCKGDTFILQGEGGETYLWTPADFLNDDRLKNPKAFPPNTELYQVVVTSKDGCHDTDFVNLEVHPYAKAGFTPGALSVPFSAENIQFANHSTGANQFAWFVNGEQVSNQSNFEFELADTGLFYIKMVSKNDEGCNDSIEQQIRVLPVSLMYVPNAFTPNGDGINETFAPSTFYFEEYEMTIFNRWGQRIWKSRKGETFPTWDATMDQSIETVPVGTYQYIIKGVGEEGQKHEYVGKVQVVK